MEFKSFEDVVKFAMEKEKEARQFYEDLSRKEALAPAKETFKEFAEEEAKHYNLLESFLKGEKTLDDYDFKWIPDMKRVNYLVDMEYEEGLPYSDLLILAAKREEKALALYQDLYNKVEDEELKKVLKMLRQEEAKHKAKLETLYDDLMAKQGD